MLYLAFIGAHHYCQSRCANELPCFIGNFGIPHVDGTACFDGFNNPVTTPDRADFK